MDLNEQSAPFGLGQFIITMRIAHSGTYNSKKQTDQQSYHDILSKAEKVRQEIQSRPYCLPLYILLAQLYSCLGYPDLAAGAAYKSLLLSDAVQNDGDEYHELVVQSLSDLISSLASDEERQAFHAESTMSLPQDDAEDIPPKFQSIVTQYYLPLIYQILIDSLRACAGYRSAFLYYSQARKLFPENPMWQITLSHLREDVAQYLNVTFDAVESGKYCDPSTWPDSGSVRRERYPWNDFEPARLNELSTLNAMMSEVAPKLEVLAIELPDLNAGSQGNSDTQSITQLGVFAKEDIKPGEIVLIETTMLTANNKLQDALCDACSAELPRLSSPEVSAVVSCPDCEIVFCSANCMENAMDTYHPAICDRDVESIAKDVPSTEAADALYSLLLLRCLAMAETQQCHPLELKEVKYIWGDFSNKQVETHLEAESMPRTLPFSFENNIRLPFHMLEKMDIDIFASPQYDVWVFNTLYAKFRGTASARLSGLGGRHARGPEVSAVHPMWCLANHSCDPNVGWQWGGDIKFWAREQRVTWKNESGEQSTMNEAGIKKGEEILNHYCDVELPVKDRREWAKGALGGNCRCARCVWEAGEDLYAALRPTSSSSGKKEDYLSPTFHFN